MDGQFPFLHLQLEQHFLALQLTLSTSCVKHRLLR
jgi:hypothetical protein